MSSIRELREFVSQVKAWLESISNASRSGQLAPRDLELLLSFISKVVEVVTQAFEDIQRLLIILCTRTSDEILEDKQEFLQLASEYQDRAYWSKGEQLCARLKSLTEQFEKIQPAIDKLLDRENWQQIFYLIHEHEGRIVQMMKELTSDLCTDLESATTIIQIESLQTTIAERRDYIRDDLIRLNNLHNELLGLSGRKGLLELIRVPDKFDQALNRTVLNLTIHKEKSYMVEQNMHVGGNVVNSKINQVAAESISESFKAIKSSKGSAEELKGELKNLAKLIQESLDKMNAEVQEEVAARLSSFTTEALRSNPNSAVMRANADGLVKAAQTVAAIAKPVADTVKTILQLLGVSLK